MSPLVSVIIPFFNEVDFVVGAVRSVLEQTYPQLEVVVVDDGSTEDIGPLLSLAAAASGVKLIRQVNGGPGLARNRGMAEAQGDFIAFLDADDLFVPDKVAVQVAAMQAVGSIFSHTSYGVSFQEISDRVAIIHSGRFDGRVFPGILGHCPIATPTVMIGRLLYESGFRFETGTRCGEDVVSWWWTAERTDVLGIDRPLSVVRWSETSAAVRFDKAADGLKFMLERAQASGIGRHSVQIAALQFGFDYAQARAYDNPVCVEPIRDLFGDAAVERFQERFSGSPLPPTDARWPSALSGLPSSTCRPG